MPRPARPFRTTFRGNAALDAPDVLPMLRRLGERSYGRRRRHAEVEDLDVGVAGSHGSELVRYIMLRSDPARFRVAEPEDRRPIILQAQREADEDGVAWTPFLDVLAVEQVWPPRSHNSDAIYETGPLADPDEWLEARLRQWVRQVEDPAEIQALLGFEAEAIHHIVAGAATILTPAQVEFLLNSSQRVAWALANNPTLMERHVGAIAEHFHAYANRVSGEDGYQAIRFLREIAKEGRLPQEILEWIVTSAREHWGWKQIWASNRMKREVWESLQVAVALEDVRLTGEGLRAIADAADDKHRAWALCHPNAERTLWAHVLTDGRSSAREVREVLSGLLFRFDISADLIEFLLDEVDLPRDVLAHLGKQHAAQPDQLLRLANEFGSNDVLVVLAGRPDAVAIPEIRERVIRSRSPRVAEAFIWNARGEEYASIFRKVVRSDPDAAALALEHKPADVTLEPGDLAPLLDAEDDETRLRAIRLLGTIRNAEAERERESGAPPNARRRRG